MGTITSSDAGGESENEGLSSAVQAHFKAAVLTEAFDDSFLKKRPLQFEGAIPSLGNLAELDIILAALVKGSETGHSGAYKNGESYMRSNLFHAYLDHASLTLNDAERFIAPLLTLCTSFSPTFHYVSARIVIDPPGVQMPSLQADSDMLAIQIWGEQRLKICVPIAGLPVTAKRPDPLLSPTMRPGDAVFVPQGMEVRFEESLTPNAPTLYAALSLRTGEQQLGVSIGKHLTDVLRSKDLSEETDRFLRSAVSKQTVPRRLAKKTGVEGSEAAAAKIANLDAGLKAAVADLSKQITAASLREHMGKRMEDLRKEQAEGAAKMAKQKLPNKDEQVFNASYIRVARGVVCSCKPGDSRALFTRGTETLPLPIAPSASYLISELCDGKPHLVSSLKCSDPMERLCVCQLLVFKQCFDIHLEDSDASQTK